MLNFKELKEIKGDASFRKFYRNKENHSIVVYAKKEKIKNLLIYDAINKILIKNKILAPKLLSQNYENHLIEVEDFGDNTLFKILENKKTGKVRIFKKILKTLNTLQSIKDKHVINFKNQKYKVKEYNSKILSNEACLFSQWYASRKLNSNKMRNFEKKYKKEIKNLLLKLKFKNDTFVHRDFHISNLILYKEHIYLIDNQDAVFGNPAYDLCSLVDDVRYETSNSLKNKLINYYQSKKKINFSKKDFMNDFEIHSIIRNLKIIGIFTRLSIRDKKHEYLKLIPHAWKLLKNRLKNKNKFDKLRILLNQL